MFFQKEIETLSREELTKLQLERLQKTVERCYNNVPHYKNKLKSAGITPDSIKSLDDMKKLPFTKKHELRDNYPFGLFASPMKEIVRLHASSGTTGKPTVVGYTKNDLNTWSDLIARIVVAAGATPDDVVQVAFGYGLFTGAFGLHYGLEKLGATVIPMSSGNTEKQIMIMEDFGVTALVATPSYALYLSEVVREMGVRDRLKLRVGFFGAEACTPEMREKIEQNFNIIATDNYGMSELMGPGVSGECIHRCGLHIWEDHFIPEIINPETLEVLPEGEQGELVITPISKEGFPIFRYRTGDITKLNFEPCVCGRTHVRMDKVTGRCDDMLIIKGVNVFPSQIESVLMGIEHIGAHYQLIVRKDEKFMDTLEVQVELVDGNLLDKYSELEALNKRIRDKLHSVLGLVCKVRLVEPKTIERSLGKAKRVIDLRNIKN